MVGIGIFGVRPTWQPAENGTVGDSFNFTTIKLSDSFSLAGTLSEELNAEWAAYTNENVSLPGTCNSSYYNGNYTSCISQLPGDEWWSTRGWTDYKVPSVNVTFDENTANLALEGKFSASPYMRANDTNYMGGWWTKGEIDDNAMIQGTIQLTFIWHFVSAIRQMEPPLSKSPYDLDMILGLVLGFAKEEDRII
ncbi:uncharacterized protein N7473_003016 [Penicillium subrubescens]|uniref:uncharacterized protein n=1 Tax=Penicillium subrubescens TaxID=1316194 RepID=UPI0025453D15|nr:uncharacterized protein N7473_003016 [Penicillium subrubescens]KAJ5906100.1 hypothetical protein N7473_003016 [Penicillium subrubescens]